MAGVALPRHARVAMALEYEIEGGVLILRTVSVGHSFLRDALSAAGRDARSRSKMPLVLDLRGELANAHYEDIRWRVHILAEMRQQFGPRWALVTEAGAVRPGVSRMVEALSEPDGLEVGLFSDRQEALRWLTEK
jgi:hypothetical protein